MDLRIIAIDWDQRFGDLATKESTDSIRPSLGWRQIINLFLVIVQYEVDLRVGERQSRERFDDVSLFGLSCF